MSLQSVLHCAITHIELVLLGGDTDFKVMVAAMVLADSPLPVTAVSVTSLSIRVIKLHQLHHHRVRMCDL